MVRMWKISEFSACQSRDLQSPNDAFVCWNWGVARTSSSAWENLLLLHVIGILHLHLCKYQAPYVFSKEAPGSTVWVLATILLQNVTKSLLGCSFKAWYFLLGWYLIQVFLAFSYRSTTIQILECLCLAWPPCGVLYLQAVDRTLPWKAHRLFLLAGALVQDSSGWSDASYVFCTSSAFIWLPSLACRTTVRGKWLQGWKQVMGMKLVGSLHWGEGSLLAEPVTFSLPSQAKADYLALPLVGCGCYEDCQTGSPEDLTRIQQCLFGSIPVFFHVFCSHHHNALT